MNKIHFVFVCLAFVAIAFTIGYKVGDSRGYADGYNEGYLYDCREEIKILHDRVVTHEKALDFTDQNVRKLARENDSLKRPALYQANYEKNRQDSIKYSERARQVNDSLGKLTGLRTNFILPTGRVNEVTCLMFPKYKELRECKEPGYRLK